MNRFALSILLLLISAALSATSAGANTSVVNTNHNLSRSGPGSIKALTEDRVCVFCHTPHNANPLTPLWNKKIDGINYALYTPYTSSTMVSPPPPSGPTGSTRLCLSCHDGTIALGQVMQPAKKIEMTTTSGIPASSPAYIGTSLANHHPVSFSYYSSLPNAELAPVPPAGLLFYGSGIMQCTTCHDPHDNTNKKFLRVNNTGSGLCAMCHIRNGWDNASHNLSQAGWNLAPTNPWPRTGVGSDFGWTTVQQNGCENCHAPHGAGGAQRLLNYAEEENNCYPCHNGNVASKNIQAQMQKPSSHQVAATTIGMTPDHHDTKESPVNVTGHVECVDCHNPHAANAQSASPPAVTGRLKNVSGVDIDGSGITPPNYAVNEYEVCFKCHAGSSSQSLVTPIPRVVDTRNKRIAFQPTNPSFHPVADVGKNPYVPSLYTTYEPGLSVSSKIYCTSCHDSDESPAVGGAGPKGPHGSNYSPLLRQRYVTGNFATFTTSNFALCFRCHNSESIRSNDSFKEHDKHTRGENIPCSNCHDPHGVPDDGTTGSHAHLINFDTRYVEPLPGSGDLFPRYESTGFLSGTCTLRCHKQDGSIRDHDHKEYHN